ncbi:hypothetical protein NSQ76_06420 [Bacillus sp. FSL M8-0256]|uniref:hypothetical protein n=1 Tax=Bacillus sp. FSL M8-0256 TaxID=2954578 RepID=UPI0030FCAC2D
MKPYLGNACFFYWPIIDQTPFYEPSEEVKETVDHIVEEYKDEIEEVLSVIKDVDVCRDTFSFVDPQEWMTELKEKKAVTAKLSKFKKN